MQKPGDLVERSQKILEKGLKLQNYVVMRVLWSQVLQGLASLGFMGKLA